MKNLSDVDYWNNEWEVEERKCENFIFRELVEKYIPYSTIKNDKTYFEIGCAPGSVMAYFNKYMGYKVSGIDYADPTPTREYLNNMQVTGYTLYNDDFLQFSTDEKYDVVSSLGFIEHFTNVKEIIDAHKRMVKDEGYLLIALPNLRYLNWLIYKIVNPKLLDMHNLEIMDLNIIKQAIFADRAYEIVYANYYKTSLLGFNAENAELDKNKIVKKIFLTLKKMSELMRIDNIPNKFFSPYIVVIAKKKGN